MKNIEIEQKLSQINLQNYSLEELNTNLQLIKEKYVEKDQQEEAKQIWVYQRILEIHKLYVKAFSLLKNKQYYKGWCVLEQIEITINSLKRHFQYNEKEYYLWNIEKSVLNLQVIFPYKLFNSIEILHKSEKCSICGKIVKIRNLCEHIVGEIYNGEMCYREVVDAEILNVSLVENPGNKFSVFFLVDENTGEQIDQYNYDDIDYLFSIINNPYEQWDLEVSQQVVTKNDYGNIDRNDLCPCGSNKKFKNCCGLNIGKKYPHYEFIVNNPNYRAILSNTIKKK
ncbi:MAG: SEC-C domain-containing protein [Bacteroidales bacterium]|nr:SEC-C domain-containing protein [Bacteroidales bacterium]